MPVKSLFALALASFVLTPIVCYQPGYRWKAIGDVLFFLSGAIYVHWRLEERQ